MGPGGTMPVPGISAVQTQETDESLTRRNETGKIYPVPVPVKVCGDACVRPGVRVWSGA